jgi:hypothetical protein
VQCSQTHGVHPNFGKKLRVPPTFDQIQIVVVELFRSACERFGTGVQPRGTSGPLVLFWESPLGFACFLHFWLIFALVNTPSVMKYKIF